jgi:Holliday junction resolvase
MNSREKGKRGERQWRDVLRSEGFLKARRGQQFAGGSDSPDVICEELEGIHFEVKRVERLNVYDAIEQANRDSQCKMPVVAARRNACPWVVVMWADDFFDLVRKSQDYGVGWT